ELSTLWTERVSKRQEKRRGTEINDRFIDGVRPKVGEHAPELNLPAPPTADTMLEVFLKENGELRQLNAKRIEELARKTSPTRLWDGPFVQLGNSKVEAAFADHRTYIYKGKDVDHQVHLGFDLAVTSRVPIVAANAG